LHGPISGHIHGVFLRSEIQLQRGTKLFNIIQPLVFFPFIFHRFNGLLYGRQLFFDQMLNLRPLMFFLVLVDLFFPTEPQVALPASAAPRFLIPVVIDDLRDKFLLFLFVHSRDSIFNDAL